MFLRVLCASGTCLAPTEAERRLREHVVQSNPVSEGSKAFDSNIICLNYITFFFGKTVGELVKMW